MENLDAAKEAIRKLTYAEMQQLIPFFKNVLSNRRSQASEAVIYTLKPGDKVKLINIKPRYMIGSVGTVTQVRRTKVLCSFPETSWAGGVIVPAAALTKID